jgi:ABC-2 type transport system permease protein
MLRSWQETLHLIRELAVTDFKLKYQGSVMSYLWSLIKPLSSFAVMYLVFVKFLNTDINPVSLFLGIVLWSYFSDFTSSGLKSIVDRGDLIRKIYFPRAIIVIASSLSAFITLLLNLLAVLVFMIFTGTVPSIEAPLFLLLLVELYALALGMSLILSALYVRFRDISHIWEVILQVLFYSSGILYVLTAVPAAFRPILSLNPIVQIVQDARNVLTTIHVTSSADVLGLWAIVPYAIPFIMLGLGILIFNALSKSFAENV